MYRFKWTPETHPIEPAAFQARVVAMLSLKMALKAKSRNPGPLGIQELLFQVIEYVHDDDPEITARIRQEIERNRRIDALNAMKLITERLQYFADNIDDVEALKGKMIEVKREEITAEISRSYPSYPRLTDTERDELKQKVDLAVAAYREQLEFNARHWSVRDTYFLELIKPRAIAYLAGFGPTSDISVDSWLDIFTHTASCWWTMITPSADTIFKKYCASEDANLGIHPEGPRTSTPML